MKLLLILAVVFVTALLASPEDDDPCSKFATCQQCVDQAYCGWCSTYVVYNDGSRGKQCAGFDPDHPHTRPFTCHGRYQTTECTPGWVCDYSNLKCFETAPGQGDTKEVCEETCVKPPQTYVCDQSNLTCVEASPGHGASLPVCQQGCFEGYACNATSLTCFKQLGGAPLADCENNCGKKSNNTPSDLLGVWRGLQVNGNYLKGEWQANFGADSLELRFPKSAKILLKGQVQLIERPTRQLYITINEGPETYKDKVLRVIYQYVYGPEVRLATLAISAPDGPLPSSYDEAMTTSDMTVLVMMQCLDPTRCKFKFDAALEMLSAADKKRLALPEELTTVKLDQKENLMAVNDSCRPFLTCPDCIAQKFCGWCSTKVVYNDSSIGGNCAGFNPDNSKKPFVCKGTYSTNECPAAPTAPSVPTMAPPVAPVPPVPSAPVTNAPTYAPSKPRPSYKCNATTYMCFEVGPGQGSSKEVCEQTCHPPKNVTPIALIGKWRGLEIDQDYQEGEWTAVFNNVTVVLTPPNGDAITGRVAGDSSQLWVYLDDGSILRGIWQVAYGIETKDFGWAIGKLNDRAPKNFAEAMNTAGMVEYEFVSCLKDNCSFKA